MAQEKGDASLSRQGRAFTVQASPFNVVKFDLAIILVLGILLLLVHDHIANGELARLGLLVGYGLAGMAWIVVRTRRVSRRLAAESRSVDSSAEQD